MRCDISSYSRNNPRESEMMADLVTILQFSSMIMGRFGEVPNGEYCIILYRTVSGNGMLQNGISGFLRNFEMVKVNQIQSGFKKLVICDLTPV